MHNTIKKRNGHKVPFDPLKPLRAVERAYAAAECVPTDYMRMVIQDPETYKDCETVQDIADRISEFLFAYGPKKVYDAYNNYRTMRAEQREKRKKEDFKSIINVEKNDITNDNANMSAQIAAGMAMKIFAESSKAYALEELLAPDVVEARTQNYIYPHDLDYYATRCLNCVSENTFITIKTQKGDVKHIKIKELDKYLPARSPEYVAAAPNEFVWVLGRNGWTKIKSISRHQITDGENLYKLRIGRDRHLVVTGNHIIPVIRDGKEANTLVDDILVGDKVIIPTSVESSDDNICIYDELINDPSIPRDEIIIKDIRHLRRYLTYRYHVTSLPKYLGCSTYPQGSKYLTIDQFEQILNDFEIPYDVFSSLSVGTLNSKGKLPIYLPITDELAEVIGYIHSEGCIRFDKRGAYQVFFGNKDENVVKRYVENWSNIFAYPLTICHRHDDVISAVCSSKLMAWLFKYVLGRKNKAYDIEVPQFILNGTQNIKWHYLSALIDGDGCINPGSSCALIYTTTCKPFAESVVKLLADCNVQSAILEGRKVGSETVFNGKVTYSNYDNYNVSITGYENIKTVLDNLTGIKQQKIDNFYAQQPSTGCRYQAETIYKKLELHQPELYVYDLETTEHWFVANGIVVHNCIQVPADKFLYGGYNVNGTSARACKRIESASAMVCIALQTSQNEMFGGQAIPAIDFYLAPAVRMTYEEELKNIQDLLTDVPDQKFWGELKNRQFADYEYCELPANWSGRDFNAPGASRIFHMAMNRTIKRVHQAMESLIHNLNHMKSRGGCQVVFSSINYGTDTSAEGRLIIRELLNCCMEGVGNGSTAIFPIHVFKCKEGVNKNPGDPNYDLYMKSLPVCARRFFPNYLNLDSSFNFSPEWDANDPARYMNEVATMGALAGKEHLYVKMDGSVYDMSIQDLFDYCKTGNLINARPAQIFCDKEPLPVLIGDKTKQTKSGIAPGAGVYAITYIPEDITYIGSSKNVSRRIAEHKCHIKLNGRIDTGANPVDRNIDNYKFEVLSYTENYKEEEKYYIQRIPNINFKGASSKYYKLANTKYDQHVTERPNFRQDRTIPQDFINIEDKNIMVLDRDNKWTKIKHIFKNDKHNSPFMMHIYYIENGKEFCLTCTEDHPLYNGEGFTRADRLKVGDFVYRLDGYKMPISRICWHDCTMDSYDIGTVTGSFIGSDIIMHNCRTRLWDDRFGPKTSVGRGNASFTSINIVKLAIESAIETGYYVKTKKGYEIDPMSKSTIAERMETFFHKLDKYMDMTARQLVDRFEWQSTALARQAPLVFGGMMEGSDMLKPNDIVRESAKHCSLSIGFIGLAETLIMLCGKHHGESDEAQRLGMDIIKYMRKRCDNYADQYDLNFSLFGTPAEGLASRFVLPDRKTYGLIENVTTRDFYTNSTHVPVWYHCSPQHKAEIEGVYHKWENAGHIFYVEADSSLTRNPEAIDAINRLAWKNDIGYSSVNHTEPRCEHCSYEPGAKPDDDYDAMRRGEVICPKCGGPISTLDRVTGYLSGSYNKQAHGKAAEILERVIHS